MAAWLPGWLPGWLEVAGPGSSLSVERGIGWWAGAESLVFRGSAPCSGWSGAGVLGLPEGLGAGSCESLLWLCGARGARVSFGYKPSALARVKARRGRTRKLMFFEFAREGCFWCRVAKLRKLTKGDYEAPA